MARLASAAALVAALALGACAVAPPEGPRVVALPGPGKTLVQFNQDDATCRGYASAQTGYASPSDVATQSAVNSAGLGTLVGAVAGVILGAATGNPGAGAAFGAGGGLLLGSAAGSNAAEASAASLQQRYDISYLQCMVSNGNRVPTVASPYAAYPGYYPAYPGYYYPAYPAY
jgi:Glycine-zipper domain